MSSQKKYVKFWNAFLAFAVLKKATDLESMFIWPLVKLMRGVTCKFSLFINKMGELWFCRPGI